MKHNKLKNLLPIVFICLFFVVCKIDSNASTIQVSASLPSNVKTVSSGVKMFEASLMYGITYSDSRYPVKFIDYGRNGTTGSFYNEKSFTINVGQSASAPVDNIYNYHKITLTGWNVNSAVQNYVGYGYIAE